MAKDLVNVGDLAPDFELTDVAGGQFHLAALRGRPVVLVFNRGFG